MELAVGTGERSCDRRLCSALLIMRGINRVVREGVAGTRLGADESVVGIGEGNGVVADLWVCIWESVERYERDLANRLVGLGLGGIDGTLEPEGKSLAISVDGLLIIIDHLRRRLGPLLVLARLNEPCPSAVRGDDGSSLVDLTIEFEGVKRIGS